jgi:DNA-binding NarL/FixJ family response regulator
VCGEAATARDARSLCAALKPDLVVLGLPFAGPLGNWLVGELIRLQRGMKVVVVSARDGPEELSGALRAGALGFLRRVDDPGQLCAACEAVMEGRRFASEEAQQALLRSLVAGGGVPRVGKSPARSGPGRHDRGRGHSGKAGIGTGAELSPKEQLVFERMGAGLGPKALAEEMGVSVRTVETHQARIREKCGARSIEEVRRMAAQKLMSEALSMAEAA